jgi:hypothetical protein
MLHPCWLLLGLDTHTHTVPCTEETVHNVGNSNLHAPIVAVSECTVVPAGTHILGQIPYNSSDDSFAPSRRYGQRSQLSRCELTFHSAAWLPVDPLRDSLGGDIRGPAPARQIISRSLFSCLVISVKPVMHAYNSARSSFPPRSPVSYQLGLQYLIDFARKHR